MNSAASSRLLQDGSNLNGEVLNPPSNTVCDTWVTVKDDVKTFVGTRTFDTWIAHLILVEENKHSVTLAAPSGFVRDRIRNDYLKSINLHWMRHDQKKRYVKIEAISDLPNSLIQNAQFLHNNSPSETHTSKQHSQHTHLTRSFDTLVEGNANELAVGIAKRLAQGQAEHVSVVLFHGPNGVGKSHLLESIKEKRLQRLGNGSHTVLMGAEELMLAFVEGVKQKDTSALRQKIRSAAVLLLDDIHLLKQGTLREFFSHLRAITSNGGWVVMSSDAAADRLEFLDHRMRDDMHAGVEVRINPPDLDMRSRIIQVKASLIARDFPDFILKNEWVELLAQRLPASGRAIDGAVRTIFAATLLVDKPVTEYAVKSALGNDTKTKKTRIETIKDVVAHHFNISRSDIESPSRNRNVSLPRQIAMYIARKATTCSYPQIGRMFGGRDHTTVIYACTKIAKKTKDDPSFADMVDTLLQTCVNHPNNCSNKRFLKHPQLHPPPDP